MHVLSYVHIAFSRRLYMYYKVLCVFEFVLYHHINKAVTAYT